MKVIIIGGGGAGVTFASMLKKMMPKAKIDIFTLRNDIGYPPCEMPFVLSGEIKFKNIFTHPKETIMNMFNVHLKTKVKSIDIKNKKVIADKVYKYDKLVIATGGKPFTPFDIEDKTNVYHLSTDLSSARAIARAKGKSVAIIGAGAIGLELAQAFRKKGKKVSIIEHFDRVLPNLIDKETSVHIEEILKKHKVKLYHSTTIKNIKGKNKKRVIFDNKEILVDFVVVATGSRPNIDLAKEAGIKVDRGVIVDKFMRTNKKDVYAIGDVITGWDIYLKHKLNIMVANNAIISAKVAAFHIAGHPVPYIGSALPFSITIFGNLVQTLGWNEEYLKRNKIKFKKAITEGMTRKPELGGGKVVIKLLGDSKGALLGAQIFSEDLEFQEMNKLIAVAYERIPVFKASFYETSYTPTIDMPINALSIAMSMMR